MKAMKLALLGTAALAAASVSARADSTSDLKAQIEALNARVASLETAPAVPAGYSMVSFTKEGTNHIITIMPSADAPAAAATVVSWTGWVKAGVGAVGLGNGAVASTVATAANFNINSGVDVRTQAEVVAHAKTDTAVGEIGATIALETAGQTNTAFGWNGGNGAVTTDGFSGYWKLTPNVKLTGGILGNLSKTSYSWDGVATNNMFGGTGGSILATNTGNPGDPAAIQLAYADGPLSFAVQVEDGNNTAVSASAFGASAKIGYAMDIVSMDIGAGVWGSTIAGQQTSWAVSAGVKGAFSGIQVGMAAGTGVNSTGVATTPGSIWAKANLSDVASIELGATHEFVAAGNQTVIGAGIYYTPVAQLNVGLEGAYTMTGAATGNGAYSAGLVTVFKF